MTSRSSAKSRLEKRASSVVPVALPRPPAPENLETRDVIPGRLTENAWVTMVTQEEGEEAVAELVAQLESRVLDECYELYLQKQLVPFTVSWVQDSLVQTVDWLFLLRDEGEGADSAPLWEEDPEAEPSTSDSWAEGCVPVHYYCVSTHTPLLQKLLDLCSVESDSPSKAQPLTNQELSDRERQTARNTTTQENVEPDIPENTEPAVPSFRCGRQQPRPSPPKASAPTFRPREPPPPPPPPPPKHTTRGPLAVRQRQASCILPPPLRRPRDVALPKRIDPAHLPQHHIWPEVVVLEPSPPRRCRGGLRPLLQPNQDPRDKVRREPLTPLTCPQGLPATQKRSSVRRTQGHILHLSSQQRGSTAGFTPLSTSLSLDAMTLVPGVSVRAPAVGKPFSGREEEEPGWVPRLPKLKPIRGSLPSPLWSLDQVVAGKCPRVTPSTGTR